MQCVIYVETYRSHISYWSVCDSTILISPWLLQHLHFKTLNNSGFKIQNGRHRLFGFLGLYDPPLKSLVIAWLLYDPSCKCSNKWDVYVTTPWPTVYVCWPPLAAQSYAIANIGCSPNKRVNLPGEHSCFQLVSHQCQKFCFFSPHLAITIEASDIWLLS